ncbi:MAG: tetratricopeptide repeat protein [Syntrophobacteraceae bacterium]
MNPLVDKEDWAALTEVLERATSKLSLKQVEPVKQIILEFITTAAMLELNDLADVGEAFNNFLVNAVAPRWDDEATATLSFSIGALAEKMQLNEYGTEFSSGLSEILLYLDLYEVEEPPEIPDSQDSIHIEKAPEVETVSLFEPEPAVEIATVDPVELIESNKSFVKDNTIPKLAPETMTQISFVTCEESDEFAYVMDTVEWYRELLRSDPFSTAFSLLAEELCLRGRWKEALETCKRGLTFHPQHIRGRTILGWALSELGEIEEASRVLEGARRDLESDAILYRVMSEVAEKRGNSSEAADLTANYRQFGGDSAYPAFEPIGFDDIELPDKIEIQPPASMEPPTPVPPPKEPRLLAIFAALQEKFESKPEVVLKERSLFSDEARESLKEILRTSALH